MESNLNLKLADFKAKVGNFLGYGFGPDYDQADWSTQQLLNINDCVESGLRRFYFPANGYVWSFLKPVYSTTIAASATYIDLPFDFGGLEGPVLVTTSSSTDWAEVKIQGDTRRFFGPMPDATGKPMYASIEPVKELGTHHGQRFQMRFFPTTDAAYTLQFRYNLLASALSVNNPYAYGGLPHAETLLESCLAIAEQRIDDSSLVHAMEFDRQMARSIEYDRQLRPQTLGYNGDPGSRRITLRGNWEPPVTFEGVEY